MGKCKRKALRKKKGSSRPKSEHKVTSSTRKGHSRLLDYRVIWMEGNSTPRARWFKAANLKDAHKRVRAVVGPSDKLLEVTTMNHIKGEYFNLPKRQMGF